MYKFLSVPFIALLLIIGAVGFAPAAHAATCKAGYITDVNGDSVNADGTSCTVGAGSGAAVNAATSSTCPDGQTLDLQTGNCVSVSASGVVTQGAPPVDTAAANTQVDLQNSPPLDGPMAKIMNFIMSLFAWLLGVAMITLNNAVYYTVVTMGNYVHNLNAVGVTWSILRDIGNIMLIFGFLAIGITTILNVDWYGGGKKMLPMLLVAAVFLNFSLFLTEAIIDTGNLFATQFYTQINGGTFDANTMANTTISNEGISTKIMSQLGLAQIYGQALTKKEVLPSGTSVFIAFMSILLFLIAAFVMFSLAFVLIARFIILLFLIILAPVGFAGLAVPQLRNTAKKWWDALFQQTITAPVLLLMLYIALTIITDANFLGFGPTGDWTGFVPGNGGTNFGGFASILLSFFVAMGLLLAVVIFSKKLSTFAAGWASQTAGKLTLGATAFGLRSTVGWGSQVASQAIRRSRIGGTKTGRVLATTFDKGAKASFDVRGAKVFGGLKAAGIEAGEAQKGGYRARQEAAVKGHQDYIKSVGGAIDERGAVKADSTKVEEAKKKALKARDAAKSENEAATRQVRQQKTEVERLEEEKRRDRYWGTDPKKEQALEAAKQKLVTSEEGLAAADKKLTQAEKELATADKQTVADITKARISSEKKGAQEGYAKNISGSFPGWVMFGPGGAMAAKKIIKEANTKKSEKEKVFDLIKEAMEKENKDKEAAAPAAAAPAPAAAPKTP